MRLDKALDILYGELLNTPYISAFSGITHNINKIKSGNLVFLHNHADAKKAIELGAYGIIFEGTIEIIDNEIAWIKVNDIKKSIKRLVRYLFLEAKHSLILTTSLELALAKNLHTPFYILQGNSLHDALEHAFMLYQQSLNHHLQPQHCNTTLTAINDFFSLDIPIIYSKQFLRTHKTKNSIAPTNQEEAQKKYFTKCKIISYSLFECKIIYQDRNFTLPLPYIFLPFLESLIAAILYWSNEFSHSNSNTTTYANMQLLKLQGFRFEELELYFIDSANCFTTTNKYKTLIFCKDWKLFICNTLQIEDFTYTKDIQIKTQHFLQNLQTNNHSNIFIEYLKIHASHLHIFSCYPKGFSQLKTTQKNIAMQYAHITHLCQILERMPYNLAIIYGISRKEFDKTKLMPKPNNNKSQKQANQMANLFDFYAKNPK